MVHDIVSNLQTLEYLQTLQSVSVWLVNPYKAKVKDKAFEKQLGVF